MGTTLSSLTDWQEIGRGGFATVYRAQQPHMARTVAVKILTTGNLDDDQARRFRNECRTMGALGAHPNIVSVFDAGTTDAGLPYLVMEFVAGGSLATSSSATPLPAEEVLDVGVQMSGALETAHRAGVFHRDVKPANILRGPASTYLLTDFGIASLQSGTQTETGYMAGTVAYLAPEIIDGARATQRTDVYSLGSTLHALLTGRSPFGRATDETPAAAMRRIMVGDVGDLSVLGVAEPVAAVVHRAMSLDPADRYGSAAEMGQDLVEAQRQLGLAPARLSVLDIDPIGGDPNDPRGPDDATVIRPAGSVATSHVLPVAPVTVTGATAPQGPELTGTPPKRRRAAAVLLSALFVLLVAAAAVFFWFAPADDPSDVALSASTQPSRRSAVLSTADVDAGQPPIVSEPDNSAVVPTQPAVENPPLTAPPVTPASTTPTTSSTTSTTTTTTSTTTSTTTPTTVAPTNPPVINNSAAAESDLDQYFSLLRAGQYSEALQYWTPNAAPTFEDFVEFWNVSVGSFEAPIDGCNVLGDSGTCIFRAYITYSAEAGENFRNRCFAESSELAVVRGPTHFLLDGQRRLEQLQCP